MSTYDALLLEICQGASSEYSLTEFKYLILVNNNSFP